MARVARDKHQIPRGHPRFAPREKVRHPRGLVILVDAEEAGIEVVTRKLEVVGIAAKECDLLLGREDEPHVGVFLGAIEMVAATLIERDHVAAEPRGGERFLFDLGHHAASRGKGLLGLRARLDDGLHAVCHVFDRDQNIELHVGALELGIPGGGIKAVAVIVV